MAEELMQKPSVFLTSSVFAVVAIWASVTGYYLIFSNFAIYQDDGYLMMTVKNFVEGGALYDEVYTQYGPAYYLIQWTIHSLLSLPITQDVVRLTSLVIWILTSIVCGLLILRLTRSTVFGAIGFAVSFLALSAMVAEPGHPQDICGLLIVITLFLFVDLENERSRRLKLVLIGVSLAIIVLTKINLGVFLGLAAAITFSAYSRDRTIEKLASTLFVALALALPFIMFSKWFAIGWFGFSIITSLSLAGIVLMAEHARREPILTTYDHLVSATGFVASAALIIVCVMAKGSSLQQLVNGIFLQNLRFGDLFYQPAPTHFLGVYWAVLGFATAFAFGYLKIGAGASNTVALLKVGFGFCVVGSSLLTFFVPNYVYLILNFGLPFLWLLLLDTRDIRRDGPPRLLLATAGVLLTFQVFPIAGTHLAYANLLPTIAALFVLRDGILTLLENRKAVLERIVRVIAVGVATVLFLSATYIARKEYLSHTALDLPGSTRLRLPQEQVEQFTALDNFARETCSTLFSMPGLFNFNFWSGVDTPTKDNATAWMTLLDERRQNAIQVALEQSPRPCVIYNKQLTNNGLRSTPIIAIPLANYILENFHEQRRFGDYIFLTKNNKN